MCVATALRLIKNKYDSNAEGHSSNAPGAVARRDELNRP
jgi:hypothetical protein